MTNSITSTHPTTYPTTPFIRIPTVILQQSLHNNKYILPLYIYSAINNNIYYSNMVDTNINLIADTFGPNQRSVQTKFKIALEYLLKDNINFSTPFQPVNFSIEKLPVISKSSRLQYIFLDRSSEMDDYWIKFNFDEYYYLLEKVTPNSKYNIIDLFNLYTYFKYKIILYTKAQAKVKKEKNPYITLSMYESLSTICKHTKFSRNTLSKYINQLVELKMIRVKKGKLKPNSTVEKTSNEYSLSSEWKNDYYQIDTL